jgi:enoyl-CoA hydratase
MPSLIPGTTVCFTKTFNREIVLAFGALVDDYAPIHFDETFAKEGGFAGCVVHGFLLGSVFSGMLGQQLPGPLSVINTVTLKMHRPTLIGESLEYQVKVDQFSEAVGAVVLSLTAKNSIGEIAISGKATCSFPKRDL